MTELRKRNSAQAEKTLTFSQLSDLGANGSCSPAVSRPWPANALRIK